MNIARPAALLLMLSLLGASPAPVPPSGSGDAAFAASAKRFFDAQFRESPIQATQAGVHTYDTKLDDVSSAAIARRIVSARGYLSAFNEIDPRTLSPETAIDRTLIVDSLRDDLLSMQTLEDWRHNPDMYTGLASNAVFLLISRNFAPASVRLRDAIARESEVPGLLENGRRNIWNTDAATKEISYEDAAGAVDFFAKTVPQAFSGVHDASLQRELSRSTRAATAAVKSYAAWIKRLHPKGTYAIGTDAYQKRLQYEDALDMPVSEYLSYGERALDQTRVQFIATAKRIDPHRTPQQVFASLQRVHPAPGDLLRVAQRDLGRLRAFVVSHHIITLPPNANIRVIPTPPFERAFITAAEDSPGPLETVATQAYYYVTPPDPAWPKARQEGFMAQFNDFEFPIISAHEVYPGHFTNFSIDRTLHLSLTRKLMWSSEFAEGWAHYSEQMMVDQGWGNGDPRVRLAQLDEALLRECRYVAGVKLHTAGWSLKKTEDLFVNRCFQTPAVALEETMRGTQDPMYGYYTLGKLMILKLRDDYKKKMGSAYTLEGFHDALLAHGDPPVPLLRPILLGSSDDGKPL